MSIEPKLEVIITDLTSNDLDELMQIEELAYGEHHWSKDSYEGELNNKVAKYYALKQNNKLIAYAGVWNIVDEAHITTIAVHKEYQRKHFAEVLITRIFEDCYKKRIKYLTLEVRESNIAAIKLYEKFGMQSLGKRKGYYQDNGESAIIMWSENIFSEKFQNLYKERIDELNKCLIVK